jgi:hypothetical protein
MEKLPGFLAPEFKWMTRAAKNGGVSPSSPSLSNYGSTSPLD